jgi:uncharacterized membrane protein YfcA
MVPICPLTLTFLTSVVIYVVVTNSMPDHMAAGLSKGLRVFSAFIAVPYALIRGQGDIRLSAALAAIAAHC